MPKSDLDDLKKSYIEENEDVLNEATSSDDSSDETNQENIISKLESEKKELEDKYLRANAEFANMQRRLEKQKNDAISYATQSFARDLLSVIDSLELSLKNENVEIDDLKKGIQITLDQFGKVFKRADITEIECEGEFDPNFHEAIMKIDSEEVESGHIVEVLQKGYKIKDRVLRAAMVSIAN